MKRIPLTQGKFALVDDEDYEWLSQWKWRTTAHSRTYYAQRDLRRDDKRTTQYMHRLILGNPDGLQVDHIDHDGLNNQRANLRICNSQEQNHNQQLYQRETSSRFKGVSWAKSRRKWQAQIMINSKNLFLCYFTNEEEAARAYDAAAREYFGAYAYLNFPKEGEHGCLVKSLIT